MTKTLITRTRRTPDLTPLPFAVLLLAAGCGPPPADDAAERLARDFARQQAAQQRQLIEETRRLSESSRSLVESDAAARREMAEFQSSLQQGIQSERQGVDRQRERLDDERREIEARRHRDPLIAAALVHAATLVVAALPVVVLVYLFKAARDEPAEAAVGELLVREFSSDRPLLLPAPVVPPKRLVPPGPATLPGDSARRPGDGGPVAEGPDGDVPPAAV